MPPPVSSYKPNVQRSIGEALSSRGGEDSPVMNETLSVIDEHITDLSTPRQSVQPPQRIPEDSESEYSSHLDRLSFLAGPDTEDEDNGLSKEEVSTWDYKQTANHLRSLGVDSKHCDIFEEQEITGEVLLDMDQSFLQMKEFDFGVMGKRLKTWHKIRDFQRDVRGRKSSQTSSLHPTSSIDTMGHSPTRVTSGTTLLPRIPSLNEKQPGLSIRQSQHAHPSIGRSSVPAGLQTQNPNGMQRPSLGPGTPPLAWRSSMGPDSPSRAAASQHRDANHSRRHSSIDFGRQPDLQLSSNSLTSAATPNKQKSSFDRDWLGGDATPASTNITSPSVNSRTLRKQESLDMSANSPLMTGAPNLDLDRGYFSGNEVDNRKARNVLRKSTAGSPGHSRQSSLLDEPRKAGPSAKRHSRLSSVDSSRDPGPLVTPASKAYYSSSYRGRFRSASARGPTPKLSPSAHSPTVTNLEVTNLEDEVNPTISAINALSNLKIPAKARKLMGLRAASEAVTNTEKATASSSNITNDTLEESPVASPDGSHTPSITGQSVEVDNTDTSSKGTEHPGSVLGQGSSQKARPKTKHQTSAYAKGLLKLTPEQARKECDYHGWMKKKSSSIVTTFKPRLFILRGRRLSYYYSENDTEERGIIDISAHKVLVANSDPMATIHAAITNAKATPAVDIAGDTSPTIAKMPTPNLSSSSSKPFYFKLVPPKAGTSRAVQFTKPTIHYFQVDSKEEGRKWMGEIMKATIEHDIVGGFETTNKQKTISLLKAQRRKERPPALKEAVIKEDEIDAVVVGEDVEKSKTRESGLNIKGVGLGTDGSDPAVDKSNVENEEPKPEEKIERAETTTLMGQLASE